MVMGGEWAQKDAQRAPGALTLPLWLRPQIRLDDGGMER